MSLLVIPGCTKYARYYDRRKHFLKKVFIAGPIPDGPAVIFVHGTKESIASKLVHKLDYPYGIVSSKKIQVSSVLSRIAHHLREADSDQFSQERFYFYGWHGKLNFQSRIRAAERLYQIIRDHKGPLTIITHSHGSNVALHLAEIAQEDPHTPLKIDRLICLAPPVQAATKNYVHAPIFKRVYNFYSTSDLIQIGDPQGLYWESYAYSPSHSHIPLLSKRTFDPAPNIMQIRVMLDRQSPGHLLFMLGRFIRHVPRMIQMVDERAEQGGYQDTRNLYIINVPPCGLPLEFLTTQDIQGTYIPRSTFYKARRKARDLACIKVHKTCSIKHD